ncbi:class I SAM-dependent methyltransferase [Microlunatus soli]|uniref:methyltransferase n=1 Tax=Microlunatus soli TaxID=630515 RepID=UPI0038B29DD6
MGLLLARLCAERGRPRDLLMVDADDHACELARQNADHADLQAPVEIRRSLLQSALSPSESFPIIVADPPWVPRNATSRYPEDPLWAIDGGDDGLIVARHCLTTIARHLMPDGFVVLQLGTEAQIDDLAGEYVDQLELVTRRRIAEANGALAVLRCRSRSADDRR